MHEYSIATSIVETVLELAKQQNAKKIIEVRMKIGKLRVISVDQLKFSYEILSKNTLLQGSQLNIQEVAGSVKCPNCGYANEIETSDDSFHFGMPSMVCPSCGDNLSIEDGYECLITKVRMLIPTPEKTEVTDDSIIDA